MKTSLTLLVVILTQLSLYSQKPAPTPASITNICGAISSFDAAPNTYFADLDGTFNPFIGTWKYINGNEIVTFQLSKITQRYFADEKVFMDFMVGNYSYSNDGGISLVVNTITTVVDVNPENNPMYTPCIENNKLIFIFKDVVLNKGYCYATFEFMNGSTTQMHVKIENPKEVSGCLDGVPPYNFNFTLPTQMLVTKQ